jgi:hypothetical protein
VSDKHSLLAGELALAGHVLHAQQADVSGVRDAERHARAGSPSKCSSDRRPAGCQSPPCRYLLAVACTELLKLEEAERALSADRNEGKARAKLPWCSCSAQRRRSPAARPATSCSAPFAPRATGGPTLCATSARRSRQTHSAGAPTRSSARSARTPRPPPS